MRQGATEHYLFAGPQVARNLRGGAWRAKAGHMDLRVGLVLVMNLGCLTRAKCAPQQGACWAALGFCDLRRGTWHESRFLGKFCWLDFLG